MDLIAAIAILPGVAAVLAVAGGACIVMRCARARRSGSPRCIRGFLPLLLAVGLLRVAAVVGAAMRPGWSDAAILAGIAGLVALTAALLTFRADRGDGTGRA
jgi:Na+/H+ antiporter NhaC